MTFNSHPGEVLVVTQPEFILSSDRLAQGQHSSFYARIPLKVHSGTRLYSGTCQANAAGLRLDCLDGQKSVRREEKLPVRSQRTQEQRDAYSRD